jgi:hypothetical protein
VAARFGLTIQEFLQLNVGRIPSMDVSLVGKSLLVCQIRPSSAWTVADINGVAVSTHTPTPTPLRPRTPPTPTARTSPTPAARTSPAIVQGAQRECTDRLPSMRTNAQAHTWILM